jgi:hypothetical protein
LERINIEVRDNDSRFSAKLIQEFLKRTIQVFTSPYIQENGHIESFHAILAKNYAFNGQSTN